MRILEFNYTIQKKIVIINESKKDPIAQTDFIIDKIEASISSLGGKLSDVVKTRVFVKNIEDWKDIAETHGKRFKGINPANTLVQAKLVGEEYLVEIEAEAIIKD